MCDTPSVRVAGRSTNPSPVEIVGSNPTGAWMSVYCDSCVFRRLLLARIQLPGPHKEICILWDSNQHSTFLKATASTCSNAWAAERNMTIVGLEPT